MCGSLIVLEMENISQVQNFADEDPYAIAGLFKNVEIRRFLKAFPRDEIKNSSNQRHQKLRKNVLKIFRKYHLHILMR